MPGTQEKAEALAAALFAAHENGQPFTRVRGPLRPATLDEGYDVQHALNKRYAAAGRGAPVGYKVGLTAKPNQELYKTDQPISGEIFASTVHHAPAQVRLDGFVRLGIEFELGFEIGDAFRAEDAPFAPGDAQERVAACMPAFELIDDRNADYGDIDALSILVDNAWCDGVVLGPRLADWRALDLATTPASLRVNDEPPQASVTGAAMGHPLNALVWLANQRAARGESLDAGKIVMTGSTLQLRFAARGDRFAYEVAGVGTVEAEIV